MGWITQVLSAAATSAVLDFFKSMVFVCFLNETELGLRSRMRALCRSRAVSHCGARSVAVARRLGRCGLRAGLPLGVRDLNSPDQGSNPPPSYCKADS